MMIKKVGSSLKHMGSFTLSVFGLFVLMMVMGTTTANAQALKQGQEAKKVMKAELSSVTRNNCVKTMSSSIPQAVRNQMNELRCEFYLTVYNLMPYGGAADNFSATSSRSTSMSTEKAIGNGVDEMSERVPNAETALDYLAKELRVLLQQ